MSAATSLRVAICCHSVNPRGGVAHGLALGEALAAMGHEPVVFAPDPDGAGFYRRAAVETVAFAATTVRSGDVADLVGVRSNDYAQAFADPALRDRFHVFHAQDGLSGNALASLKAAGRIARFARTVHHVDAFRDPWLIALQRRAIVSADAHFVVSRTWRDELRVREGLDATVVGNGVATVRFTPKTDGREAGLRDRLGLGSDASPIVLAVGGVEERKNTQRLLAAFAEVRRALPSARLVIAGGASLLDHGAYRAGFETALSGLAMPDDAVVTTGPLGDEDMPALYRMADVLAFPSVREGFGLAALEAMACGTPVVVSAIAPFTEYLGADDVAWCDPTSAGSIADAISAALSEPRGALLAANGLKVAAQHDWRRCADAHLGVYQWLAEAAYA